MAKKIIGFDKLESLPNVGAAIAGKLRFLGYRKPSELTGEEPYEMYEKFCELTGKHHDPCLLDVFISAVSFCNGNPPKPWWEFTKERKTKLNKISNNDKQT
jgi:hypothetical protein